MNLLGWGSTQLSANDDLVALDNTAYLLNGVWTAEFVISVFSRKDEEAIKEKVEHLLEYAQFLGVTRDVDTLQRIGERMKYFVAVPRKDVSVLLRGVGAEFKVGPTRKNGVMSVLKEVPWTREVGSTSVFNVVPPPRYPEQHFLNTVFAREEGWTIISGIIFCKVG